MTDRFGSPEQHEAGAGAALPKIQVLLANKYPNCVVTKEAAGSAVTKDNIAKFTYLRIRGPKAHLIVYAGAFCDFTLYDFNHGPAGSAVFTSGPEDGAKDRKMKPLSWSINCLDTYLGACHAE